MIARDGAWDASLVVFALPFGATVLDLPGGLPLPAKITVEVRPPIDLVERFGSERKPERVYEAIIGEMQDSPPSSKKSAHSPSSDMQAEAGWVQGPGGGSRRAPSRPGGGAITDTSAG